MKAKITCLLLTALILVTASLAAAQSAVDTETLTVANELYENGRFAEAAQTYEQLVQAGIQDSTLFYNLGNAYYQQGALGQAILNYERARRLTPRDPDLRANLALARSQVVDQYDTSGTALNQLAQWVRGWLTLNETAVLTLALWSLLIGLILFYRRLTGRWRELAQGVMALTAVCFLAALLVLGTRLYLENGRVPAIILLDEVAVFSGPGEQYPTQFYLHQGAEVGLLEQRPHWVRLTLPDDQLQGWVPADGVAAIPPGS